MKKKKWIGILTVVLVLAGAALVAAKSREKADPKGQHALPARQGPGRRPPGHRPRGRRRRSGHQGGRQVGRLRARPHAEGARGRDRPEGRRARRDRAGRQPGAVALGRAGERQGLGVEAPGRRARVHDAEGALRSGPPRPRRVPLDRDQARPGGRDAAPRRCATRSSRTTASRSPATRPRRTRA